MEERRMYMLVRVVAAGVIFVGVLFVAHWDVFAPHVNEEAAIFSATPTMHTPVPLPPPRVVVSEDGGAVLGSLSAPIAVIEFTDFTSTSSKKFFEEAQPKLFTDYIRTNKVRLVMRVYPISDGNSIRAAEAAKCAGEQGLYWAYAEQLFKAQPPANRLAFSATNLKKIARSMFMDNAQFDDCFNHRTYQAAVAKDATDAQLAGVTRVPAFSIGSTLYNAPISWNDLKQHIQDALKNVR